MINISPYETGLVQIASNPSNWLQMTPTRFSSDMPLLSKPKLSPAWKYHFLLTQSQALLKCHIKKKISQAQIFSLLLSPGKLDMLNILGSSQLELKLAGYTLLRG